MLLKLFPDLDTVTGIKNVKGERVSLRILFLYFSIHSQFSYRTLVLSIGSILRTISGTWKHEA